MKKHLGAAYKPLFEANLSAFEVSVKLQYSRKVTDD